MTLTLGYQTEVRWDYETSEGGGFTDIGGDVSKLLSDSVKSVGVRVVGNRQTLYDIGSPDALAVMNGVREWELVVEFNWQDTVGATPNGSMFNSTGTAGLIYDCIVRQANGRLKTVAFELYLASDAATKTVATLKGCKPDTAQLGVDADGVDVWTITFKPGTSAVVTGTALPAFSNRTRQSSIGAAQPFFTYVTAGALDMPSGTPIAAATKRAGFTVKHNLTRVPDIGNPDVKTWAEGKRQVTFDGEITVDDGGKVLLDAAMNGSQANIVFRASTTASKPKFTLLSTFLGDLDLKFDNETPAVTTSITREAVGGITVGVTP